MLRIVRASLWSVFAVVSTASTAPAQVVVMKTPDGGIQPRATVDARGTLHLLYFKGEALAGDLYYESREAGAERFAPAIRVNHRPGSAVATGTVRGGQLALGKGGRAHVAWNGSGKVAGQGGSAMLYARLNDAGTAFQDERDVMGDTAVLDGGGTVAADALGNVYVAWHALKAGSPRGEEERQVWVARSTDEGKTFSREAPAWTERTGVCPCCSMRAIADQKGFVTLLYRSATDGVNRDIYRLASSDHGITFDGARIHRWKVPG